MGAPLDELYLTWLYRQFGSVKTTNPTRSYWTLARQLFTKQFIWIVPNDDNRVEEGRYLRYEFMHDSDIDWIDDAWMQLECSFLEMLVALTRRLSFEDGRDPREWMRILLDNIGLLQFNDASEYDHQYVDEVLDRVIWRTYAPDGTGGLFPLHYAKEDQRDVELWYQMCAYLLEQ